MTVCLAEGDAGEILTIFIALLPVVFYILGVLEGRAGRVFVAAGLLAHLLGMAFRGLVLGSLPITEKHDTISFMAFSAAAAFWLLERRRRTVQLSLLVLPLVSLFLFVASLHAPINTVSPFMRTPWFLAHVLFTFAGYGLFGLSCCLGLLSLARRDQDAEQLQYRTAVAGWTVYTVGLVCGSIWFYIAYGTYWLWTSRELWTTLAWFYYGLYLHARMMPAFRGRPAAGLGVLGFVMVMFSYFGVGTVIPSPPTQF